VRVQTDGAEARSEWAGVSHPVLRPKLDAHRMYAHDQVVIHTARM
jgi:hypothetical protein